jgi:menaquinone-dependent protoporphyrinogen oxidase
MRKLPAARAVLPEGDFRDWRTIEAWADEIATALSLPES